MGVPETYFEMLKRRWDTQLNGTYSNSVKCTNDICITRKSCQTIKPLLSNITFRIGDKIFELTPASYLLNGTDLNTEDWAKNTCIIGVMPFPSQIVGVDMFLLGDIFLKNFYSVYDFDEWAISFAVNRHAENVVGIGGTNELGRSFLFYCLMSPVLAGMTYYLLRRVTKMLRKKMKIRAQLDFEKEQQ